MSPLDKAQLLADMAKNAQVAGDIAASLELAIAAAQYLQLARLLTVRQPKTVNSVPPSSAIAAT